MFQAFSQRSIYLYTQQVSQQLFFYFVLIEFFLYSFSLKCFVFNTYSLLINRDNIYFDIWFHFTFCIN